MSTQPQEPMNERPARMDATHPPIADAIDAPLPHIDDAYERVHDFMSEHLAADEDEGRNGLREFAWVDRHGDTLALSAADIITLLKAIDAAYPLRHRIGVNASGSGD